MENHSNSLSTFFEYLQYTHKTNQIMIIGYNILSHIDIERNLKLDISLDIYDSDELNKLESTFYEEKQCYILNIDFNLFCVLSKGIIDKFSTINKINQIIFDSSTFKFMSNIKLIALFYYIILEENGTIYIESNKPVYTCSVISNYYELMNIYKLNYNGFYYPSGYCLTTNVEKLLSSSNDSLMHDCIVDSEQIYEQNMCFIKKWFYGSTVELLDNSAVAYPITNKHYPITKYYKITKSLSHDSILKFMSENVKEYNMGLTKSKNAIIRLGH